MFRPLISILFIFICSLVYWCGFSLNMQLFQASHFSAGVNWVFLPAGLRLLLVLIFGIYGAIGVGAASVWIGWGDYFPDDHLTALISGIISGLSPYLARFFILNNTRLSDSLNNLGPKSLLICICLFSVISPLLHQAWFYIRGYTENFSESLSVMIVGDLIGSFIVVYAAKLMISLHRLLPASK